MYWDYGKRVDDFQRRMVRHTRIAIFIGGSMVHFVASSMLLAMQTSCAWPPCVDGIWFELFRGVMHLPLFVTPWLGLPPPNLDYVRDPALMPLLMLNAALATALYWGSWIAVRRGYAFGKARRYAKQRAARRAR